MGGKVIPDDVRIGACADYLLGVPTKVIELKWGITHVSVRKYLRRTGSFKLRNRQTNLVAQDASIEAGKSAGGCS